MDAHLVGQDVRSAELGREFETSLRRTLGAAGEEFDPRAAAVVWHVIRVSRIVETRLTYQVHQEQGWSWSAFRVAANLFVMGSVEPGQLARILGVSRPTISKLLARMEASGHIVRGEHPESQAQVLVHLTDEGQAAFERMLPPHHRGEIALTSGLSASEQEMLAQLLQKLYFALAR